MNETVVRSLARSEYQKIASQSKQGDFVSTTTNSTEIVAEIETVSYTVGSIEYEILAIKDDGATKSTIKRVFDYVNNGSTLSISSETTLFINNGLSVTVVAAVNGTSIEIRVTGLSATNILWKCNYQHNFLTTEVAVP